MTTNPPTTEAHQTWILGMTHLGPVVFVQGEAYGRAVDAYGKPTQCQLCGCSIVRVVEEQRGSLTRFCADCGDERVTAIDEMGDLDALRAALAWSMFAHKPGCGSRIWCSCKTCVDAAFARDPI